MEGAAYRQMHTTGEFVRQNGLTISSQVLAFPVIEYDHREIHYFRCTLSCGSRASDFYYSLPYGQWRTPCIEEVLDALAMHACFVVHAGDMRRWASMFGYDPDDGHTLRMWKYRLRDMLELRRILGEDLYEELVYHTMN